MWPASRAARRPLAQGTLVRVLTPWRSAPVEVFLVYRVGSSRIRRVAAVAELLRERAAEVLSEL